MVLKAGLVLLSYEWDNFYIPLCLEEIQKYLI